jgi:alginate O-acetyltransferase complex protein AlgI
VVFSSAIFLLYFLPVFLLVYTFLPKSVKNWWILLASIFFYAWGAPQFLFILIGSTIIDFFIVQQIDQQEEKKKKRLFLVLSLTMNLGLLAYFKYANFFIENVNAALGAMNVDTISWTQVALPIGISFYTFQTLTYSIDVYRGVHKPLKHLHNYLLYIMSFPQMIAGPIVRFNLIADQIVERKDTIDDKLLGFFRFCIGLAKKVLIANVLGAEAKHFLELPPDQLTAASAWLGIIAYTFQIYFDFSGYYDGIHIPGEFQYSLYLKKYHRILEKMAYHARTVDERLSLHSAWRE